MHARCSNNQTTGLTDANAYGTTLASYAYTYDLAGRATQESRVWASGSSTDTLTYGYTNNNQLTSVTHTNAAFANESFAYDANGNQTGTGYTTAAGNEQTASPGYTYTYDADGNMITSTQTATGDVWTYGYDFRNQLTSAVETSTTALALARPSSSASRTCRGLGLGDTIGKFSGRAVPGLWFLEPSAARVVSGRVEPDPGGRRPAAPRTCREAPRTCPSVPTSRRS